MEKFTNKRKKTRQRYRDRVFLQLKLSLIHEIDFNFVRDDAGLVALCE